MRIPSVHTNSALSSAVARRKPQSQSFELELAQQQKANNLDYVDNENGKDDKAGKDNDDKTGKLVTAREGGYIRSYIIRSDGSKILISEIKQEDEQDNDASAPAIASAAGSPPTIPGSPQAAVSPNTQQIISLLNLQAGIKTK